MYSGKLQLFTAWINPKQNLLFVLYTIPNKWDNWIYIWCHSANTCMVRNSRPDSEHPPILFYERTSSINSYNTTHSQCLMISQYMAGWEIVNAVGDRVHQQYFCTQCRPIFWYTRTLYLRAQPDSKYRYRFISTLNHRWLHDQIP